MLNRIVFLMFWLAIATGAYAQTREIYTSPNFAGLAQDHQTLAILPFKATVNLRPKQMEKLGAERHKELERDEGLAVQSALQTYFLKRKEKKAIRVNFQDIARTNAILAKNGITEETMAAHTPEELATMLGVDGIITDYPNLLTGQQ